MDADQRAREEGLPSRHERRRRETRERIATTALNLFRERGYDAVTIAEIAAAADVAKQTVVNHFPAKEDLLLAWHRPVEADLIDLIVQVPLSTPLPRFLREELPRMFAGAGEVLQAAPAEGDPRTAGDDRLAGIGEIIRNSPTLQDALRLRGSRYQEELAAILADRVPARLGPVAGAEQDEQVPEVEHDPGLIEQSTKALAGAQRTALFNSDLTAVVTGPPSAELAALLAEHLGKELVISNMDFDAVVLSVGQGKADIGMAGLTIKEERKQHVNFSDKYYDAAQMIIVKASDTRFDESKTTADVEAVLAGLNKDTKIGFQTGTTGQFYVEGDEDWGFPGLNVTGVGYRNGSLAVQDMLNGNLDLVIIDEAPAKFIAAAINEMQ